MSPHYKSAATWQRRRHVRPSWSKDAQSSASNSAANCSSCWPMFGVSSRENHRKQTLTLSTCCCLRISSCCRLSSACRWRSCWRAASWAYIYYIHVYMSIWYFSSPYIFIYSYAIVSLPVSHVLWLYKFNYWKLLLLHWCTQRLCHNVSFVQKRNSTKLTTNLILVSRSARSSLVVVETPVVAV